MPIPIHVPRLGWTMDEGTLSEWLKRDGEFVREGEALFELESDKATQEVESFDSGVLRLLPDAPQPGDSVRVGQLLGYLCAADEPLPTQEAIDSEHASATSQDVAGDVITAGAGTTAGERNTGDLLSTDGPNPISAGAAAGAAIGDGTAARGEPTGRAIGGRAGSESGCGGWYRPWRTSSRTRCPPGGRSADRDHNRWQHDGDRLWRGRRLGRRHPHLEGGDRPAIHASAPRPRGSPAFVVRSPRGCSRPVSRRHR